MSLTPIPPSIFQPITLNQLLNNFLSSFVQISGLDVDITDGSVIKAIAQAASTTDSFLQTSITQIGLNSHITTATGAYLDNLINQFVPPFTSRVQALAATSSPVDPTSLSAAASADYLLVASITGLVPEQLIQVSNGTTIATTTIQSLQPTTALTQVADMATTTLYVSSTAGAFVNGTVTLTDGIYSTTATITGVGSNVLDILALTSSPSHNYASGATVQYNNVLVTNPLSSLQFAESVSTTTDNTGATLTSGSGATVNGGVYNLTLTATTSGGYYFTWNGTAGSTYTNWAGVPGSLSITDPVAGTLTWGNAATAPLASASDTITPVKTTGSNNSGTNLVSLTGTPVLGAEYALDIILTTDAGSPDGFDYQWTWNGTAGTKYTGGWGAITTANISITDATAGTITFSKTTSAPESAAGTYTDNVTVTGNAADAVTITETVSGLPTGSQVWAKTLVEGAYFFRNVADGSTPSVGVGYQLQSLDGVIYQVTADLNNPYYNSTLQEYIMPATATFMNVPIQATSTGSASNVLANTLTLLPTPLAGIDGVTNQYDIQTGIDAETDSALVTRFQTFIGSLSDGTLAAVSAAIEAVEPGLVFSILENQVVNGSSTSPQDGNFVVVASDANGNLGSTLFSNLFTAIDTHRPLTVTFNLTAPNIQAPTIQISLSYNAAYTQATVESQVQANIFNMFSGQQAGATLYFNDLIQVALNTPGVVDVLQVLVNSNGFTKIYSTLATPTAPAVSATGTTGSTSYTYYVVARDATGNRTRISSSTTITNGNATLSGSNYNTITWTGITGAVSYDILRGSTGTAIATHLTGTSLNDTGLATFAYPAPPYTLIGTGPTDVTAQSLQLLRPSMADITID